MIYIDSREPKKIIDLVKRELNIASEVRKLEAGDYAWGDCGLERKSVVGSTPVFVRVDNKAGVHPIKDVVSLFKRGHNIEALGFNFKTRKPGWYKVYSTSEHTTRELFGISFNHKTRDNHELIHLTSGHNVWRLEHGMEKQIPSKEISPGDWLFTLTNVSKGFSLYPFEQFLKDRQKKMSTKKGYEIKGDLFRLHSSPNWVRIPKLTKAFGFFTGLWLGDGCFTNNRIVITQKNKERNKIIEENLQEVWNYVGSKYDYYFTANIAILEYLKMLGFKSGSQNKVIPYFVFDCNLDIKREVIRGLFFSDGWSTFRDNSYQIKLVSKSKYLVTGLSILLSEFGITHNLRSIWKKYKSRQRKYYLLEISKTNRFLKVIGQIPTKEINSVNKQRDDHWEIDRKMSSTNDYRPLYDKHLISFRRVFDVKRKVLSKPVKVYDLAVEECENFLGGFHLILLHNTLNDMWNSITSNKFGKARYWDEIIKLKQVYNKPFVIVIGYLPYKYTQAKMASILGAITKTCYSFNIPVLKLDNEFQFIEALRIMYYSTTIKKPTFKPLPPKHHIVEEVREEMLCCLPGIGRVTAKKILKDYPSPKEWVGLTPKDLKKYRLRKKSKKILKCLGVL